MSASWDVIGMEILTGCISTTINLLKVLVPLMIIVELLMVYKLVEKMAVKMNWIGKLLGIGKNAILPLLVGIIMGVTYGAGTLVEMNKVDPLTKRDFALIGIFMFCCHGILEATFLFGMAGANVFFICVLRLLIATAVTMIAARLPYFNRME